MSARPAVLIAACLMGIASVSYLDKLAQSESVREDVFSFDEVTALQTEISRHGYACTTVDKARVVGGSIDFPRIRVDCDVGDYVIEISSSGATAIEIISRR